MPTHTDVYLGSFRLQGPSLRSQESVLTVAARLLDTAGVPSVPSGGLGLVATRLNNAFKVIFPNLTAADWRYKGITLDAINAGESIGTFQIDEDLPGGAPLGSSVPPVVSAIFTKNTSTLKNNGRQVRGRWYWPGITEGSLQADGAFTASFVTGVAGNSPVFLDALNAATTSTSARCEMVVSYKPAKTSTTYSYAKVNSFACRPVSSTNKSRIT